MKLPTRRFVLVKAAVALVAAAAGSLDIKLLRAGEMSAVHHTVEIFKFKFIPETLTVRPGDAVTWLNRDIAPHTATAKDKSWDTGPITTGSTKSIKLTGNLPIEYFCRFHPMMAARLEVAAEE